MSEPAGDRGAGDDPAGDRCGRRAAVAAAVEQLLVELGGRRPPRAELEAEVRAALEDPGDRRDARRRGRGGDRRRAQRQLAAGPARAGPLRDDPGPLGATPSGAAAGVGAALVEALAALCREQGVARIEVGLPRESFDAIRATEAFYLGNGFEHLGPRMRRLLS